MSEDVLRLCWSILQSPDPTDGPVRAQGLRFEQRELARKILAPALFPKVCLCQPFTRAWTMVDGKLHCMTCWRVHF